MPDLEPELAATSDVEAECIRLQTGAKTTGSEGTPQGPADADAARLQTGANDTEAGAVDGLPQLELG
jgi:hypothetical protein